MEAVLVILSVMSVPLTAIVGGYWIKYQKMRLRSSGDFELHREMLNELQRLRAAQAKLSERLDAWEQLHAGSLPAAAVHASAQPPVPESA